MAIIVLPPFVSLTQKVFRFKLSGGLKVIIVLILLSVTGILFINNSEETAGQLHTMPQPNGDVGSYNQ